MSVSPDQYREALSKFPAGVTVVTVPVASADDGYHGITVSAFTAVSLEPPLILICIDKEAKSHGHLEASDTFVVNILRSEQQVLSDWFAGLLDEKPPELRQIETFTLATGAPALAGTLVTLDCRLEAAHAGGDHTIFVGLVVDIRSHEGEPLIYFNRGYHRSVSL